MSRIEYKDWAVTSTGDVVGGSAVEVRIQSTGALADLHDAATAGSLLSNPLNAEADGSFVFFVEPGKYDVTVGSGASESTKPLYALRSDITYPTIAAMALAETAAVGDVVSVDAAFNGGREDFEATAGGLTADGALVVDGVGVQWVSKRTVYADFAELDGDPRQLFDGRVLAISNRSQIYSVAPASTPVVDGYPITTSSGLKLFIVSGATPVEIVYKVPTDFATLQDAIDNIVVSDIKAGMGVKITLMIESGYQIPEGPTRVNYIGSAYSEPVACWLSNVDLSFVWISSEDATVPVVSGFEGSVFRSIRSRGPVLNCVVDMANAATIATQGQLRGLGYSVEDGSVGWVMPFKGVINSPNIGCHVRQSSTLSALQANFSGAYHQGANINHTSRADLRSADLSNCGDGADIAITKEPAGLRILGGCVVDADSVNVSGCHRGISVRQNSHATAEYANATNCTHTGLFVSNTSTAVADSIDVSGNGGGENAAIYVATASNVSVRFAVADDCVGNGIVCLASKIDAFGASADRNGGTYAVQAADTGTIDFQQGSAIDANGYGLYAEGAGSAINAPDVIATGAGIDNVRATEMATVNINSGTITGATAYGAYANRGGKINARAADASDCQYGFGAVEMSEINARSATADDCTVDGAFIDDCSRFSAAGFTALNAGRDGCRVMQRSDADLNGANFTGHTGDGIGCYTGSVINAAAATGTINRAVNAITANGIVFK